MTSRHIILLLGVALFASIVGALAYRLLLADHAQQAAAAAQVTEATSQQSEAAPPAAEPKPDAAPAPAKLEGTRRPDYTLNNGSGEKVSAAAFDGKIVLVNFWATWCAPCRKEMPMLVKVHDAYQAQGLEIVGIALDEVEQAREFAANLGVDYPVLIGTTEVMLTAREYGNNSGVLPYSVLIDRDGIIRWTHLGELEEAEVTREITQLLDQ